MTEIQDTPGPTARMSLEMVEVGGTACSAQTDENKGLIMYVRSQAERTAAIEVFSGLDDCPECCLLRTRQLSADQPEDHPELVARLWARHGERLLPLTVVDGFPVVYGRIPTFDEFKRFTSGKTTAPGAGLEV